MRYFKKNWEETTGDELTDDWGVSIFYFETDDSLNVFKQIQILKDAVEVASENSELNLKGFKYEMIEAKDLIQSQLTEAYVKADYLKYVHDYLVSLSKIDNLVGKKIDDNF